MRYIGFVLFALVVAFGAQKALCMVGFCQGICFAPCGAGCVCMRSQQDGSPGQCFSESQEKALEAEGYRLIP